MQYEEISEQDWFGLYSNTEGILTPPVFTEIVGAEAIIFAVNQIPPAGIHARYEQSELDALVVKFYRQLLGGDKTRQEVLLRSDFWQQLRQAGDQEYSWMVNTRFGLLDRQGHLRRDPIHDRLEPIGGGDQFFIAGKPSDSDYGESMLGIMDKEGNWRLEPRYYALTPEAPDALNAMNENGEWGVVNLDGEVLIPFEYLELNYLGEGYWHAVENYETPGYLVNHRSQMEPVALPGDCGISYSSVVVQNRLVVMDKDYEYYGMIDLNGSWILRPEYESMENFMAVPVR